MKLQRRPASTLSSRAAPGVWATSGELGIDRSRMAVRQAVVKSTEKVLLRASSVAAGPHSSSITRSHPMSTMRRTEV